MKKPLFIAISGKKESGKDEFARLLHLNFDSKYSTEITHFADPLKEICIQLFGLDRRLVYGSNADKETLTSVMWDGFPLRVRCKYSDKTKFQNSGCSNASIGDDVVEMNYKGILRKVPRIGPMTIRELLQVMGTDIFRERVYNNIWAEYPFKQPWRCIDQGEVEIPTDVVFIADCRFPNEVAETLKNNGLVIRVNRDTGHNDAHPSETALDGYNWNQDRHFVIDNNGTLQEFREKTFRMAETIAANYLEKT
jgi:hypothetical protein